MSAASASTLPVAVIGAGPAGLMAAETLSGSGLQVILHDRMPRVGRKLLLAGRGGLNLTHAEDRVPFLSRYGAAADWLTPIIDGREERVLSLILVACALFIAWFEGPLNWQALSFCALLAVFALNLAGAWRRPVRSLSVVPAA